MSNNLKIKCVECGLITTVDEIHHDRARVYDSSGKGIWIDKNATQKKIDELDLICECCQEKIDDMNDY